MSVDIVEICNKTPICNIFRKAKKEELPRIMEIINEAYSIDIGNSGISFTNGPRLRKIEEIQPHIDHLYVLKIEPKNEIIGVVKVELIDQFSMVDIGLLAVNPKAKVKLSLIFSSTQLKLS